MTRASCTVCASAACSGDVDAGLCLVVFLSQLLTSLLLFFFCDVCGVVVAFAALLVLLLLVVVVVRRRLCRRLGLHHRRGN